MVLDEKDVELVRDEAQKKMSPGVYKAHKRVDDWSSPGFVDGYRLRDSSPSAADLS